MKRLLFPLISALTLSTAVHAGISNELHKKYLEARDYAGFVKTNKKLSHKKDTFVAFSSLHACKQ